MPVMNRRNFVAVTVTLAVANTVYSLWDLINAIIQAESAGDVTTQASGVVRTLTLQAHPGVDGVGGNSKDVLVGDALVSTSRIGFVLSTGQSYSDRASIQNVNVQGIYLLSAGTNQKVNVFIQA